nr:MAG TPA: hypothetical protein [Bacteriophage sp.]
MRSCLYPPFILGRSVRVFPYHGYYYTLISVFVKGFYDIFSAFSVLFYSFAKSRVFAHGRRSRPGRAAITPRPRWLSSTGGGFP